jgi:hypothetical protein
MDQHTAPRTGNLSSESNYLNIDSILDAPQKPPRTYGLVIGVTCNDPSIIPHRSQHAPGSQTPSTAAVTVNATKSIFATNATTTIKAKAISTILSKFVTLFVSVVVFQVVDEM